MSDAKHDDTEWIHDGYGNLRLRLRDFFAAFALAGLSHEHLTADEAARAAYQRADAMLAQRSKES